MSDSIKYSDFLIDYIDDLVKYPTRSVGGINYTVWQPDSGSTNIIFSDGNVDTIAQANQIISKPNGIIGLTKEQIYDTISKLTTDDMSFFSPKIEIYRRLPAYLTLGQEASAQESEGYVYKKLDFIDGSSAFASQSYADILQGNAGTGLAAIQEANWELEASSDAKESNTEIYDYLGKFAASIKSFDIKFKFDSAMTFFGNSQNNSSQLIANFMRDPLGNLKNMSDARIESNEITRNYAYLMFFSDIGKQNTSNQIKPESNNTAYNFLIKVGYSPVFYDLGSVITNPERLERLQRFNTFLLQYPDYFNLDFQCALGGYEFTFSKDNSISLKASFTGAVKQGSLRDLFAHRTNDMDFMKVLKKIAIDSSTGLNTQRVSDLQQLIKNNEKLLLDYDTANRLGCFDSAENSKYKSDWFKNAIETELDSAKQEILALEQKALTHFLDDVKINRVVIPESDIDSYNNTILKTGASGIFNYELFEQTNKSFYKTILETKDLNFYKKTLTITDSDEDIKKRIESGDDSSSDIVHRNSLNELDNTLKNAYAGGSSGTIPYTYEIYFFFFGDLIENIIKKFKSHHAKKYQDLYCLMPNLKVHKRSLNIKDSNGNNAGPNSFGQTTRYRTNSFGTSSGIVVDINAAYVPISMELWRKWTHDNIVKRQKQYYHLFDLLNDLKTLLTQAINYRTDKIIEREPKMKLMGRKPLIYSTFYQNTYEIQNILDTRKDFVITGSKRLKIPLNVIADVFAAIQNSRLINPTPPLKSVYLVGYTGEAIAGLQQNQIYATDIKTGDRATSYITSAGDYTTDMKLGIAHFFVGNQMGLAKTFTFGSDATPNGREMALADSKQENRDFKSYQYNNVDIKVVGGSFFRPMEMIYVHPHYTFGSPFDKQITISNLLNIGGYYQIFKVASSFNSKGVYETTLTCKYYIAAQAAANKDKCDSTITDAIRDKFTILNELRPHEERVREATDKIAASGQEEIEKGNVIEGAVLQAGAVTIASGKYGVP
jgi:hypothetical protein